jgi:hypothetical protein
LKQNKKEEELFEIEVKAEIDIEDEIEIIENNGGRFCLSPLYL